MWPGSLATDNGPDRLQFPGRGGAPGCSVVASAQFGIPNQTNVFFVDSNGALNVAWITGRGQWSGPVPISRARVALPGCGLSTSAQFGVPNQTDVFFVDSNGALNVAWVAGSGRWAGPVAISRAGVAPPGCAVVASAQFGLPDQTDVFFVDNNGALNIAWVVGGGHWAGPQTISRAGVAPPGCPLMASAQFGLPNQTDVFFITAVHLTLRGW